MGDPMPVTAKLSRRFYEQFGDEVTNELVEWFNSVDATYRGDLRELNELNFARFDANVEARFAAAEARMEARFAAIDVRFASVDARLAASEKSSDARFAASEKSLDARFAASEKSLDARFATSEKSLDARFATSEKKIIAWMFAFWTSTMLAQAAFLYSVLHARS
jgi:hypothetical protein